MLAFLRPEAWNLPLFLHVFGAVVLFGGLAAVLMLSVAADRIPGQAVFARNFAFWSMIFVVWPGYLVMRGAAQWIYDKEDLHPRFPSWVAIGVGVADGGVVVLLGLTLLGWITRKRPRYGFWFGLLTGIYLVALGVAWWAMSAKPGA